MSEQQNSKAMIFEQIDGCVKIILKLLAELEYKDIKQHEERQGCIWTLNGWNDNNLKHLRRKKSII